MTAQSCEKDSKRLGCVVHRTVLTPTAREGTTTITTSQQSSNEATRPGSSVPPAASSNETTMAIETRLRSVRGGSPWMLLVVVLVALSSYPTPVRSYPDPCGRVDVTGPLFMCDSNLSNNYTTSSASGNRTCADTANRTCLYDLTNDNGTDASYQCGNCLARYVDVSSWNGTNLDVGCILVDEVTWEMYEATHQPTYGSNVQYETDNETILDDLRLRKLRDVLQVVSASRATLPPLPYALDANKFSADLPPDYRGLAGHKTLANASADVGFERFASGRRRWLQSSSGSLPAAVDWVQAGAVTYVKNQGRCGCCWSISCMGAVEGATYITNSYIDSLSFQQLISCDTTVNEGCQGGNIAYALQYAVSNSFGGLTLYDDYPFVDSDGTTTTTCETVGKPLDVEVYNPVIVVSYADTNSASDRVQSIKQAVAAQPVSITMNANCTTFNNYVGGVLTDDGDCACSDTNCIDHAILIVGYNDTYNPPYWLIKNSWGTDWGEQGYFLVAQEGGGDWGLFGILGEAVVPLKAENVTGQVAEPSSGGAAPASFLAWPKKCLTLVGLGTAMLATAWGL